MIADNLIRQVIETQDEFLERRKQLAAITSQKIEGRAVSSHFRFRIVCQHNHELTAIAYVVGIANGDTNVAFEIPLKAACEFAAWLNSNAPEHVAAAAKRLLEYQKQEAAAS